MPPACLTVHATFSSPTTTILRIHQHNDANDRLPRVASAFAVLEHALHNAHFFYIAYISLASRDTPPRLSALFSVYDCIGIFILRLLALPRHLRAFSFVLYYDAFAARSRRLAARAPASRLLSHFLLIAQYACDAPLA